MMSGTATLTTVHNEVHLVFDACKASIEKLSELQNDELFVSLEIIFDSEAAKMDDWLFENNIVGKRVSFRFDVPQTEIHFTITGYKFRNIEHAMAFKLRWIDAK